MDELMINLTPFLRKYILPLSLGLLGVILLGYGLISSLAAPKASQDIIFAPGEEHSNVLKNTSESSVQGTRDGDEITIDVSGAVVTAGVYTLPGGSRVQDALKIAGGMSEEADTEFVARSFNLAAKLTDGAKLYIPKTGEGIGSTSSNTSASSVQAQTEGNSGFSANGLININTASATALDTLSGVGPVTAGKIIDNRPYTSVDELVSKKVVSRNVFEKIKDSISTY